MTNEEPMKEQVIKNRKTIRKKKEKERTKERDRSKNKRKTRNLYPPATPYYIYIV